VTQRLTGSENEAFGDIMRRGLNEKASVLKATPVAGLQISPLWGSYRRFICSQIHAYAL